MKQAYEQRYDAMMEGCLYYEKVELLPECKRETRFGYSYEYQKARKKFLGLIPYTKWLSKDCIVWFPHDTVEYYTCSCGEDK